MAEECCSPLGDVVVHLGRRKVDGGGFFLLHDARTGKDVFLDARETSPAAATPARFLDKHGNLDPGRSQDGP